MDRDLILRAVLGADWNVTAAAAQLGLHANTLRHQLSRLGIERPTQSARIEEHPPMAALLVELERLRAQARATVSTYSPGPHRAAALRDNEVAQRAVLAKLRAALGEREVWGGVRSHQSAGAMRPGWGLRF